MSANHPIIQSSNHRFMQVALSLARRHLGQTWPNPSVGAVLVKDGQIIGAGCTARGGRPHAETQAIAQAGEHATGATLYVTLEPCAHQGQTSPCSNAIIASGIARCVIAARDPHEKASGGIEKLRAAGIEVIENICATEAYEINRGFFSVIEKKRPYIALKIATSLDGKMAYAPSLTLPPKWEREQEHPLPLQGGGLGRGKWITGERARNYGHLLRSRYDAIATGIGTILADDPQLTCRLRGLFDCSPVRVVFDRKGRLPKDSQLAKTAKDVPLWVIAEPLPQAMELLVEKGITRVLVEAGPTLSQAFLQCGLVDRIYWFRAPAVIGNEGLAAFGEKLPAQWKKLDSVKLAPDTLEIYEKDGSRPAPG